MPRPERSNQLELPILKTERLELVPPRLEQAEDLFAYGSDPRFADALHIARQESLDEARAFIEWLIAENASGERLYWVAKSAGKAVGSLGFIFHGWLAYREAEFGYGFSPEVWGKGIFTEAASEVIEYGVKKLGLARIRVYTRYNNRRAKASVRKLGFVDDLLLGDFYPDGEACQSFALTAS